MTIELVEKPYMTVEMDDGSLWAVPCRLVAEDRASYYAKKDIDTTYDEEYAHTMQYDDVLLDWAASNMNWEDVEHAAVKLNTRTIKPDYQEGWVNGEKDIVR